MISKTKVLELFEARFDYTSARIVLADAMAKAGVTAGKDGFEPEDVAKLPGALAALGLPRVDALASGLAALVEVPAGKGKAAPAPEPEPEPEEPVEEAEADSAKAKAAKGKKK